MIQTSLPYTMQDESRLIAMTQHSNTLRTDVIRVLLVDDYALMREGLQQLLIREKDIQVIGEAVNGSEALHAIQRLHPHVVLLSSHIPVVDSIAVTHLVTREFPGVAVIMLAMHHDQQHMLQALKSGARGYLLKNASISEVTEAIRAVHAGGMLIEPEMTGAIVSELRRLSKSSKGGPHILDLLTEKELEIVRYIATGMSNKEIADKLAYSEKTVKNYLSIIFQKLNIRDRTQAAILALRQGILPEE